jgi:hypothetical protein
MARLIGSDELFRLIHSLSIEEKGYFKKFATRHTTTDSSYLKLFNAISKQRDFDETQHKKDFKNYARTKVYLKDMITDAMLVYYRNNHPHIQLLNQIQKIHLMLVKGLYNEAMRLIKKSLDTSRKMELFTIARYLERIQRDLASQTYNHQSDMWLIMNSYQIEMEENLRQETNLTELELLSMEWFAKSRENTTILPKELEQIKPVLAGKKTTSKRAEIKKTEILNWISLMQNDSNELIALTEKRVAQSKEFRKNNDSSFYAIAAFDNHILSYIDAKQFDQGIELCNEMIAAEGNVMLYYNIAFVWGNIRKWMLYIISEQYDVGLKQMNENNSAVLKLLDLKQDAPGYRAVRAYVIIRSVLLFCNRKYLDCWMTLNESFHVLKQNQSHTSDILILQMMTQLEMGNYSLLKKMAQDASKKIDAKSNNHKVQNILIDFFKKVDGYNIQMAKKEAYQELIKLDEPNASLFGLLKYQTWLKEKK